MGKEKLLWDMSHAKTWRKTKEYPKPVGVELKIKRGGIIKKETVPGNTHFNQHGVMCLNTVYSHDSSEEWYDDGTIERFVFTEEQERAMLAKLIKKYQ